MLMTRAADRPQEYRHLQRDPQDSGEEDEIRLNARCIAVQRMGKGVGRRSRLVKLDASKSGSFQDRRIPRRDRAEPPGVVVVNCLADLGLAVHHKRPVTDNWLVDRLAGQHQQD